MIMSNPFEIQMNKLKKINTSNGEVTETDTLGTSVSPLFDRRKKETKQIYSVKLQRELSDKMITLAVKQNLSFTDIIEYGLEKVFEELDVVIDKDIVRRYNSEKSRKR